MSSYKAGEVTTKDFKAASQLYQGDDGLERIEDRLGELPEWAQNACKKADCLDARIASKRSAPPKCEEK